MSREATENRESVSSSAPADANKAALLLAAIVESSTDAIVSKDLNGYVTSWNHSAELIFGYTAEEMIGKHITTIIPPELQEEEPRILAKIRAGERIEHFETVRVRKSGERIDVSLTVSPIRDARGNIIGAAKIARNITEQKRLQAALHTAERLASVGRLAATVAHEINNPLEAVTNLIYLAKQEPEIGETALRYLKSADEELARVAHIAQQTLGFYRDWSEPVRVDVRSVVEDVLRVYERKLRYKDLQVTFKIPEELSLHTWRGELKQALSNLVSNAIDASYAGGKLVITARVWRTQQTSTAGVRISIADFGVGIPQQSREQIFTPFFTSKRDMGTGLGLWITKELLEKRGGRLRFRSRESKPSGTVMSIFLPAAQIESAAA